MQLPPEAIVNEAGQVAMCHRRPRQVCVKCGTRSHVFVLRGNWSLTWVEIEDVPCILAKRSKSGCCGGKNKSAFLFATEAALRLWNMTK